MTNDPDASRLERPDRQAERELEIAQKIKSLGSKNPRVRTEAAKRLGELKAGKDALLAALQDPNSFVRAAAAEALGHAADSSDTDIVDSLMAAIDDSNDYVCAAAVSSLGRLKAEVSLPQIIGCLEDTNPRVVGAAILALGYLNAVNLAEEIATFLANENPYLASAAARALGMLGYKAAGQQILENLKSNLAHTGQGRNEVLISNYITALARLKIQEAVPVLIEIAQNEVGLRSRAVQALIDLNAESAAPALASMFADPGNKLRSSLIRMMVQANYSAALPVIRPLLKDSNGQIRQAALDAVVRMNDTASAPQIRWMCYHDPNPYLRVRAVYSLAALLRSQALPDLLALANDLNTYVRLAVAVNLGRLDALSEEAYAVLTHLADNDPVEEVAEAAREALSQHGGQPTLAPSQQPPPTSPLPVPASLQADVPTLLAILERWQEGLGSMLNSQSIEEIAETDRALTHLIQLLRNLQSE